MAEGKDFAPGDIVTVLRRGKPGYRAVVCTQESWDGSRITVRLLPRQGESDRARAMPRGALFMEAKG